MEYFPVYELQYNIFRWTGLATNDFESRTKRILYGTYHLLVTLSYTSFEIVFGYELAIISSEISFEEILFNIMSFLICLGIISKRIFVLGHRDKVKDLYLRIKKDFEDPVMRNVNEASVIIENSERFYKRNICMFYTCGIATAFLFCLPSYLNFPKELPFPVPYQEHLNRNQTLGIIIWQAILVWLGYLNFIAYDALIWGFLMMIATRMQVVAKMWEQFTDDYPSIDFKKYVPNYEGYLRQGEQEEMRKGATKPKYKAYDERMRHDDKLIRETVQMLNSNAVYYQEITEEIGIVEKIFSFPLLIHMVGGAILLGITIVFVIVCGLKTMNGLRTFAFVLSGVCNLFSFSYYGTIVEESRKVLATALYGSPWYEVDVPTSKLYMYNMSMMRNKLQYTAGGFIAINLQSYLSLMKLSYNLLAVLK